MASKRQPASRPRTAMSNNAMAPPQPPSRSRSVMSKLTTSTRSADDTNKPAADHPETNIQVVIRCRRRSEKEIQENSPIIVSSQGAKSHEVSIEAAAPMSSMGVVTLAPLKTYPFDLVFGPEADQALIYHEVVSPMLEEVLQGYNCTLFAYGQTGTGKTHTMQGDLTPTPMGNPSSNAGMIPAVKVSFIELYNEELRDLLASDLAAPIGSSQPMGMAKDSKTGPPPGTDLKIFDDSGKRGVYIQGLEEVPVKDSKDALALLLKGSQRRQIAATKFNDHSSRSHSVFSITVHIKETSTMGDDLLKVGKLNLVDLAGSENIGRSGAENKRAREAGMINQSLLTLGRVINALVDRASHVPYRELAGGRTKTCIVATVSPSRSNMEETLSTLDYAMRAKSIRNRPELNQRMSRNSLLKDYIGEIERLKADLLAAREKNGIFFSEESVAEMEREKELRQTEIGEAKKMIEITEGQLRNVREEFEQSIALLMRRDEELEQTRRELKDRTETLEVREVELKVAKTAFEEETVVRRAHQNTEDRLNDVATGLKVITKQSIAAVGQLMDKLDRKSTVMNANAQVVRKHSKGISNATTTLAQKLEEFIKLSSQTALQLQSDAKDFQTKEASALTEQSRRVDEQLRQVQGALQTISARDGEEAKALDLVQSVVTHSHQVFRAGFEAWSATLRKTCDASCVDAEKAAASAFAAVEKAVAGMGAVVDAVAREAADFAEAERSAAAAADEVARLRAQNDALKRLLEDERTKSARAKDELIQRISGLLGDFVAERDRGLRQAVGGAVRANEQGAQAMEGFAVAHAGAMDGMEARTADHGVSIGKQALDGKRTRDGAKKSVSNAKASLHENLSKMQGSVSGSVQSYSSQFQKEAETMQSSCSEALDHHSRAKRARLETTKSLGVQVQSEYKYFQRSVASTSREVEGMANRVTSSSSGLKSGIDTYHQVASSHLSTVRQSSATLAEQGAKEDAPTNLTPRKRAWDYEDQWTLTKPRDELLREWRAKGMSSVGSETFIAEHVPLPDGDVPLSPDEAAASLAHCVIPESAVPSSSVASSAASSLSRPPVEPAAAPPARVTHRRTNSKLGIPSAIGTLTDARNVYTTRSRRAR
ncbi:kinesin 2 [Schizophyllum amplum]|uniref:Kinesin 2 n=1 Tax=Schizophyllum amplum TaxID=97359 RepID=A0A550CCH3_9AGAR|nr:kinesin 2 [Auriculariopsis ampla]